jgi:hypothetical protein
MPVISRQPFGRATSDLMKQCSRPRHQGRARHPISDLLSRLPAGARSFVRTHSGPDRGSAHPPAATTVRVCPTAGSVALIRSRLGPVWGHSLVGETSMATPAAHQRNGPHCRPSTADSGKRAGRFGTVARRSRSRSRLGPRPAARLCKRCWFRSGLCASGRKAYAKGQLRTQARVPAKFRAIAPARARFSFLPHGPVPARRDSTGRRTLLLSRSFSATHYRGPLPID